MEDFLGSLWKNWQMRGARSAPKPTWDERGFVLTLCFRARVSAWFIFLLFTGLLVGVLVLQAHSPQPARTFWFEVVCFSGFSLMGLYYLLFVYYYCVEITPEGMELRRFLLRTRIMEWADVTSLEFPLGNEVIKLKSKNGETIPLYPTLHGLSYVRRSLAAFAPREPLKTSWAETDPKLAEAVPSWNCSSGQLAINPFTELSGYWP